jgi:hypothetical protein
MRAHTQTHILSEGHKLNRINQSVLQSFYSFSHVSSIKMFPNANLEGRARTSPTVDLPRLCSQRRICHSGLQAQKPN